MSEMRRCANPDCGREFAAKRKNSRYCCERCMRQAYRRAHPEVFVENNRKWRKRHPDAYAKTRAESHRRYVLRHRKGLSILAGFRYLTIVERCESDAAYYAKWRAHGREAGRRQYDKKRKIPYRPRLSCRFPDWVCRGEGVLDARSQYLLANATQSQRAFARELAKERRNYREVRNMV